MTNSFDIDEDDLDDFDMDIEDAFGFKLERSGKYMTFGELLDQACKSFAGKGGGKCANAMAYFRLRKVLRGDGINDLKPMLDLARRAGRAQDWLDSLEERSGLKMPIAELTTTGGVGCGVMALAVILPLFFYRETFSSLVAAGVALAIAGVAFAAGFVLTVADRQRLPKSCSTFGALAGRVAALNLGLLVSQGAHAGEREIRSALIELLLVYSKLPRAEITPQTLLMDLDSD